MEKMKSKSKMRNILGLGPSADEMRVKKAVDEAVLEEFDGNAEYAKRYGSELEASAQTDNKGNCSVHFNNDYWRTARIAKSDGDLEKSLVFFNLEIKKRKKSAEMNKKIGKASDETYDYYMCVNLAREAGMPEKEEYFLRKQMEASEEAKDYSMAVLIAKDLGLEDKVKSYKELTPKEDLHSYVSNLAYFKGVNKGDGRTYIVGIEGNGGWFYYETYGGHEIKPMTFREAEKSAKNMNEYLYKVKGNKTPWQVYEWILKPVSQKKKE